MTKYPGLSDMYMVQPIQDFVLSRVTSKPRRMDMA